MGYSAWGSDWGAAWALGLGAQLALAWGSAWGLSLHSLGTVLGDLEVILLLQSQGAELRMDLGGSALQCMSHGGDILMLRGEHF